jgi:putative ABC transport system substrate-binding protein
MIDRRRFLAATIALLAPSPAGAQKASLPRIGWLSAESQPDPFLEGFREGLKRLGYIEGQSFVLELRHAKGSFDALRAGAAELTQSNVAMIVASLTALRAVRAIKDVPVLFVISGDPVEAGIAKSLAHPGGNFTGITFQSLELAGKRVELLKESLPRLRTLVAFSNAEHPGEASERRATETAAQTLGINLVYVPFAQFPFGPGTELDNALENVRRVQPDGMVVFPEGATMANRVKLAQFGVAHRLPIMFGWSEYADAGGLMSYGANQRDAFVRLASYADKLLRGARPADLPVEQPTQFELVLNLKTAKLLGITIPPAVRLRADRVID